MIALPSRFKIVDTVIKSHATDKCGNEFFATVYIRDNHCQEAGTYVDRLRIVYDSHNGSSSNVFLSKWSNDNGWVNIGYMNSVNGVRIESYTSTYDKHEEALNESVKAFMEFYRKLF